MKKENFDVAVPSDDLNKTTRAKCHGLPFFYPTRTYWHLTNIIIIAKMKLVKVNFSVVSDK